MITTNDLRAVRQPTALELREILDAIGRSNGFVNGEMDDYSHCIVSISITEDYVSGSPGFVGTVAIVLWDGSPDAMTSLSKRPKSREWIVGTETDA